MSKVRIPINPMQVGRVGAYSMYVRSGEQIVRQRKNSSNYGPEASRTESQMARRVRWANLVDFYKACKSWMPKAFETKAAGQTDYNKFMQLNINTARVYLTKDMAANGCAVPDAFMVSQGSLAPLTITAGNMHIGTRAGIILDTAITSSRTIGNISADILRNNPHFQNGDNIAYINFTCALDSRGYPYTGSIYNEFTIDTANTSQWGQNSISNVLETQNDGTNDVLSPKTSWFEGKAIVADVWIHTRKVGGSLQVSTQQLFVWDDTDLQQFSTQGALQTAIDSYGVDTEVPLDPSFSKAAVQKVLWNGSVIYQKGVTSGRFNVDDTEGGVFEVQGAGLTGGAIALYFLADGASESILFTPLEVGEGFCRYFFTANGHFTLVANRLVMGSVSLSGLVVPAFMSSAKDMKQRKNDNTAASSATDINAVAYPDAPTMNYPYKVSETNPYFNIRINSTSVGETVFTPVNCTEGAREQAESYFIINFSVVDPSKPAYVYVGDYIIAVFNY